jgi:1-aminocyclopropane-1-carboxylate deaminase
MLYSTENSIVQELKNDFLSKHQVKLFLKRDDLIDKEVSGNKWRKLKYNIEQAISKKNDAILTFGGAYSNHLVATASACFKAGIRSIGIVRGEELSENSNETLKKCYEFGMELKFVSRQEYGLKGDSLYLKDLHLEHENCFIVPEGGANFYGMVGCQEILKEVDVQYDHVFVAQGTTTTSCGVLLSLPEDSTLNVVPVLKGFDAVAEMKQLLNYSLFDEELTEDLLQKVVVHSEAHFGGYGKYNEELLSFIQRFYSEFEVPLDPIYTGKVMFHVFDLIEKGEINNTSILFIHTGGVQGVKFIEEKEKIKLYV